MNAARNLFGQFNGYGVQLIIFLPGIRVSIREWWMPIFTKNEAFVQQFYEFILRWVKIWYCIAYSTKLAMNLSLLTGAGGHICIFSTERKITFGFKRQVSIFASSKQFVIHRTVVRYRDKLVSWLTRLGFNRLVRCEKLLWILQHLKHVDFFVQYELPVV